MKKTLNIGDNVICWNHTSGKIDAINHSNYQFRISNGDSHAWLHIMNIRYINGVEVEVGDSISLIID